MKQIAIIADDLTGAADSGVQFSRKGINTTVAFDMERLIDVCATTDVLVVDTDSRAVESGEAYERVRDAALLIKQAGFQQVYKKMDSTLRGNLGSEIDGIMDVFGYDAAIVAPAFPRIGRTTEGGIHYLNGIPLHLTEFAHDLRCPVRESNLVKLLFSQSKRPVGLVNKDLWNIGYDAVEKECYRLINQGIRIIVFDVNTEEDLKRMVSLLARSDYSLLWAGSAGLAEYLSDALSLPEAKKVNLNIQKSDHPVMLVAGSVSEVTGEQLSCLKLDPNVVSIEFNPVMAAGGKCTLEKEIERCYLEIKRVIESEWDIAFYVSSSPALVDAAKKLAAARGIDLSQFSSWIVNALGRVTSQIVQEFQLAGLILTGGDTAKAVCKALSVSGLKLLDELEPGIPLSKLLGSGDMFVVTKAGAFGTKESLLKALQALKGKSGPIHSD